MDQYGSILEDSAVETLQQLLNPLAVASVEFTVPHAHGFANIDLEMSGEFIEQQPFVIAMDLAHDPADLAQLFLGYVFKKCPFGPFNIDLEQVDPREMTKRFGLGQRVNGELTRRIVLDAK